MEPKGLCRIYKTLPLSLFWTGPIQSMPSQLISLRSVLILFFYQWLSLAGRLCPCSFPTKILYANLPFPYVPNFPALFSVFLF
jgi:hypothetical protein